MSQSIKVGFPKLMISATPFICACHGQPKNKFYVCPRCQAPSCEISTQCRICNILLVSSTKLSRTAQQHGSQNKIAPFIQIGKYLLKDQLVKAEREAV